MSCSALEKGIKAGRIRSKDKQPEIITVIQLLTLVNQLRWYAKPFIPKMNAVKEMNHRMYIGGRIDQSL
ncbi:hypothetical protein [Halobacillus campisalis]|uniref:Transposase n=1 Tax=Halobacillus campisalis TaxID=435909 RepID=A0ABW2K703_9BACI|nr:hypothetical protein [Halobacillus campisalis]